MEQLSKSQIILLTLFVSFVTSIATGIVTVALMGQAPPSIAQNVNRIIERTVEKVVPAGQAANTAITREKTVVVKETDLISGAVARSAPSVVRLFYSGNSDPPIFLGFGVVLDATGRIASDVNVLGGNGDAVALLVDGTHVRAYVTARDANFGVAFLQSATTTVEGKAPTWHPVVVSAGHPILGQTVIALAGRSFLRVADGIITALIPMTSADSTRLGDVIETNIQGDSIMPGGILVNADGEAIGMSTSVSRAVSISGFVQFLSLVKQSVQDVTAAKTTESK